MHCFIAEGQKNQFDADIQTERALFGTGVNDEFFCKIAQTLEEVSELIE